MSHEDCKARDIVPSLVLPCLSSGHPGSHSLGFTDCLLSYSLSLIHILRLEPSDHEARAQILWLTKDGASFPPRTQPQMTLDP